MLNKNKILICALILVVIIVGVVFFVFGGKPKQNVAQNNANNVVQNEANQVSSSTTDGITINKDEITSTAKFYKYISGNVNMEVIAVKATDGTIRTSLNTCQICYDSGRGYYKQEGNYLVCQNCGNRFSIDQIEKIKGGCNPVPVLEEDKTENDKTITISKEYLDSQKEYFSDWKK